MKRGEPCGAHQGPEIGMLEWFWHNDHAAVEQAISDLKTLGVRQLRFGFSWADYLREDGEAWFDYLVPRLAEVCEILPCFVYTPPSLGERPHTAAPPRDPKAYADFLDQCISRYGQHFDYVELWNEPNNISEWDFSLDHSLEKFAATIGGAAYWAHQRGKKTVLGGMSPIDPNWLHTMFRLGVLAHIDVVGIHGFPGSYDATDEGWNAQIRRVRKVLRDYGSEAAIWITEVGYPTWRHDEFEQVRVFTELLDLPVERAYWLCLQDLPAHRPSIAGFHRDPRDYHFGLKSDSGEEKLLYRLWAGRGVEGVRKAAAWKQVPARADVGEASDVTLITGGAGFVGSNLADRLLSDGQAVRIVDNLSRPGVERNLEWLRERHGSRFEFVPIDLRNIFELEPTVRGVRRIFHLAAQVAVTTSLRDPLRDFQINLRGTLNLLEAARRQPRVPAIIFASTNKVYGGLPDVGLERVGQCYLPEDEHLRRNGISETRNLDFHSPYGCSKGGADQYLLDYARCMGVPSVVFRMSCIYGPRQFGTEDQGWVAHFLIRALQGQPITLYGEGTQVRDVLFVDDLINAFQLAAGRIDELSGKAFNIGGGPGNTVSLLEMVDLIGDLQGKRPELKFDDWRPGDQRYYCSDVRRFAGATGWHPTIDVRDGVRRLHDWLSDSYVINEQMRRIA